MGQPNILVPVALAAFLLATVVCFRLLDPRRTALWAMLLGWLFLPHYEGSYRVPVVVSKTMFVPAAILLGSIIFDTARWRSFRPRWADLPVGFFCAAAFATAIDNDLGSYEGTAAMVQTALSWAAPYLLGRVYFGHPRAMREFATALVAAAMIYVPFCLFEIRMSPQLHFTLYGFRSEAFDTVSRFGGYRPSVFMQTGLALGLFMAVGALCAFWLWRTGALDKVAGVPVSWALAILGATVLLTKSLGAIILLATSVVLLESTRRLRTAALLLALAAIPPAYCVARLSGWNADRLTTFVGEVVNAERAQSVQFRIENERLLIEKAMLKPWLGWGAFGRSFVYDEDGRRLTVVDSMWIIVLGVRGLVGLIAVGATLLIPPLLLLWTFPARQWGNPRLAPAAVLAVALLLWTVDDLLNFMMTPVFPAIAGALVSFSLMGRAARAPVGRAKRRSAPRVAPSAAAGGVRALPE